MTESRLPDRADLMDGLDNDAGVLVLAAGAAWEERALSAVESHPGLVVIRRCMDVTDLLAVAAAGQARAAVVALDAPGLDTDAIDRLAHAGVGTVVVLPDRAGEESPSRARRIGAFDFLSPTQIETLGERVLRAVDEATAEEANDVARGATDNSLVNSSGPRAAPGMGRVTAIWGPPGAPGRTTVTLALAGELAARGADPLVIDADPYGGAIAQHLGVLDESSGILSTSRIAASGELPGRFMSMQRRVAGIRVLTGLPRADRWMEVRADTISELLTLGRRQGEVLVDTGFCVEEDGTVDYSGRPGRNAMTLDALRGADQIVVVGAADPIGLSRLARGLVDLQEVAGGRAVHVIVNRMRPSLGWSQDEVAQMVSGFAPLLSLNFLPDDRGAADRAVAAGRTLRETGDSALSRAVSPVAERLWPHAGTSGPRSGRPTLANPGPTRGGRGLRRRRGGRAPRR